MSEQKYTIMIVDDDRFLLEMYTLKFKEAGHTVKAYLESTSFLADLEKNEPVDAYVLDLIIPTIDGFELIKKIKEKEENKNAAVIVLSNQGQDSDIDKAVAMGVDGYIVKASTIPSEVLFQVESIIKKKQQKA